jgi:predicted lipoprotein with Yx(FWY)xxD motif
MAHRSWSAAVRTVAVAAGVTLTLGLVGLATPPAGAATKSKTKPTVVAASVPGVGTILVDSQGHALYTHTDANGQDVACTGACMTAWPPLTVAAGAKVKAPKGVKGLGTTSDTHQVTSTGLPLYRFSLDTQAKQAKGEGVNGFGGTWHVVTVKNTKTNATPTTNAGTGGVSF